MTFALPTRGVWSWVHCDRKFTGYYELQYLESNWLKLGQAMASGNFVSILSFIINFRKIFIILVIFCIFVFWMKLYLVNWFELIFNFNLGNPSWRSCSNHSQPLPQLIHRTQQLLRAQHCARLYTHGERLSPMASCLHSSQSNGVYIAVSKGILWTFGKKKYFV